MAISLTSVKCPECGAQLSIEENRKQAFCSYCGSKIIVSNENEYVYRHVDEEGIKRAETEQMVRMKELEIAEKSSLNKKILTIFWLIVSVILLTIGIIMITGVFGMVAADIGILIILLAIGAVTGGYYLIFRVIPNNESDKATLKNGGIRFPRKLEPFDEKNYELLKDAIQTAGFQKVVCVNLHDLKIGLLKRAGTVESVFVNGEEITTGGKIYMPDASIRITYHGK